MGRPHENHFVPAFYLRSFSQDGRRISLFNFSRAKAIRNVSIKDQCSRHNLYDFAPKLEEAFSKLEGEAATVMARIRAASELPSAGSADWVSLISFIVFQKMRTVSAGRKTDAATDYFAKLMLENRPEFAGIDLDQIEIGDVYPLAIPLSVAPEMIPVVADLQTHLFINTTARGFMTSDDPVVAHNQYCEGITYRGVTGFDSRGLQLFWPLSPEHLLLLFDPDVYRVPRADHGLNATRISSEPDIAQLNALQVLNAHQNVYFEDDDLRTAEGQCADMLRQRPKARMVFVETESVPDQATGGESALLHQYEPLLPLSLKVGAIRIRNAAKAVPLHQRATLYRQSRDRGRGSSGADMPPGRYPVKKTTRR